MGDERIVQGDLTMNQFKRQAAEDAPVIGYTVDLRKDSKITKRAMSKLLVHMNELDDFKTVKHFEISQFIGGSMKFEITDIKSYDETKKRVLLKIQRTKTNTKVREERSATKMGCLKNMFTSNPLEDRWLYLESSESMRFMLFLMEMYQPAYSGRKMHTMSCGECSADKFPECCGESYKFCPKCGASQRVPDFSTPLAAAIVTVFQDNQQAVKEYIGLPEEDTRSRYVLKGIRDQANADVFKAMCGLHSRRRRRLIGAAYYSLIGFNMLLMCGLLVGISFAYHVHTHEPNYETIRW